MPQKQFITLLGTAITKYSSTFMLSVLILLLTFVALLWHNQELVMNYYFYKKEKILLEQKLNHKAFREQISVLLEARKGNIGLIYVVDMKDQSKEVIFAYDHEKGMLPDLIGKLDPLYGDDAVTSIAISKLYRGMVACNKISPDSLLEDTLLTLNVNYVCSITVPPKTSSFMAIISIYFNYEPKMSNALVLDFNKASKGILTESIRFPTPKMKR